MCDQMCDIVVHSKVLVRVKLFGDLRGSCMRFDKSSGTGLSAEEYGFVDLEE